MSNFLLLDFVVTNLQLDGKTLRFQYKEPFEAIKEMVESKNWYRLSDTLKKYRQIIISIANEIEVAKQQLRFDSVPLLVQA